jgi:hypothetical protein
MSNLEQGDQMILWNEIAQNVYQHSFCQPGTWNLQQGEQIILLKKSPKMCPNTDFLSKCK